MSCDTTKQSVCGWLYIKKYFKFVLLTVSSPFYVHLILPVFFFLFVWHCNTIWLFSNSSCTVSLFFFIEFFPYISVCIIFICQLHNLFFFHTYSEYYRSITYQLLPVRVFTNGPGDLGSIPGRLIPKTQKMILDASLLNTQHYKVRIKSKVE